MGGEAVKKINPFDKEGTIGRAILTGGMSLPVEVAMKATGALDAPPVQELEAPPTNEDPAVEAARVDQRKARGRASTILTQNRSGSGLIARRTLLGT